MKNFVQSGEWALTVIAPTGGVVAGAIVIVGRIVGVATGIASAGAEVKIRSEGVYDLSKVPADALAAGAIAKVDPATGIVGAGGDCSLVKPINGYRIVARINNCPLPQTSVPLLPPDLRRARTFVELFRAHIARVRVHDSTLRRSTTGAADGTPWPHY